MKVASLVLASLLLLTVAAVSADTVSYTSNTIPDTLCDWGPLYLTVPKYNSPHAVLTSVAITFHGNVAGTIKYENKGATPDTITGHLQAVENLYDINNVLLITVTPEDTRSDTLPAYDGVTDFGGASGRTYTGVSDTASGGWSSSTALYLAMFTGAGNLSLPTFALASSYAEGGGNLSSRFITDAGAWMSVEYTYDVIPEPGTIALVSLGLAGIGVWRRRRGKRA